MKKLSVLSAILLMLAATTSLANDFALFSERYFNALRVQRTDLARSEQMMRELVEAITDDFLDGPRGGSFARLKVSLLNDTHQFDEAIAFIDRHIESFPNPAEARIVQALTAEIGLGESGVEYYRSALQIIEETPESEKTEDHSVIEAYVKTVLGERVLLDDLVPAIEPHNRSYLEAVQEAADDWQRLRSLAPSTFGAISPPIGTHTTPPTNSNGFSQHWRGNRTVYPALA